MITLYGFVPAWGLMDVSPYVMKTEVHLAMAGVPYRKTLADLGAAPKGKAPWIEDGDHRVADSTFIRVHLERTYGVDFDEGLDAVERAQAWALERMLEDHLAWASGYFRWLVPANFEKGPAMFFDAVPEAARPAVIADVLQRVEQTMKSQGVARHSETEIAALGGRSLQAVAAILGDKPFLFGAHPCGVDATAYAVVAGILCPQFESPLRRMAEALPALARYVSRMDAMFARADAAAA